MTGLQRMRKAASGLLLVGILMMMTTVAATAASSNQVVHWQGKADVVAVGVVQPGPSTFEYTRTGAIDKVIIETVEEQVLAMGLEARCGRGEAADEVCEALNGSAVLSVHSSIATLRRPRTIENPLSPYLPDVLSGALKGQLNATFTSSNAGGDALMGTAPGVKINGLGVYGCANALALPDYPTAALPIAACEDLNDDGMPDGMDMGAMPVMIPLGLAVVDRGEIEFVGGTGVFEGATGSARVIVTVQADASGTSGTLRIIAGKLVLPGVDDDDDHEGKGKKKDKDGGD